MSYKRAAVETRRVLIDHLTNNNNNNTYSSLSSTRIMMKNQILKKSKMEYWRPGSISLVKIVKTEKISALERSILRTRLTLRDLVLPLSNREMRGLRKLMIFPKLYNKLKLEEVKMTALLIINSLIFLKT
jgi:hypothetical protein